MSGTAAEDGAKGAPAPSPAPAAAGPLLRVQGLRCSFGQAEVLLLVLLLLLVISHTMATIMIHLVSIKRNRSSFAIALVLV